MACPFAVPLFVSSDGSCARHCPVPRWVHWGTRVRYLGHPQYLGLILIVLGLNIQSPTLPMFLMAPVLIGMNAV